MSTNEKARDLLLDALAYFDAGWQIPVATYEAMEDAGPIAHLVAAGALEDARVRLDVWQYPSQDPDEWEIDEVSGDEMVALFEEAVELLNERIRTGRRRPALPL